MKRVQNAIQWIGSPLNERMVRERLSWMRFCGLGIADTVPDASTLWDFREALIKADALFQELDRAINPAGFLPRAGQIIDASVIAAPLVCRSPRSKDTGSWGRRRTKHVIQRTRACVY